MKHARPLRQNEYKTQLSEGAVEEDFSSPVYSFRSMARIPPTE